MERCATSLGALPLIPHEADDDVYVKVAKHHISTVLNLLKDSTTFQVVVSKGEYLLADSDPSVHSIVHILILEAAIKNDWKVTQSRPVLRNQLITLLLTYDTRQVRYVGSSFRVLIEHLISARIIPAKETLDIAVHALLRLDPSGSVFTSLHPLLATAAYNSRQFDAVLPLIEKTILYFAADPTPLREELCNQSLPPNVYISTATGLSAKLKSSNILEYDLICGMIFIARRDWHTAQEALYRVITHPCSGNATSKIMVEGFKKWILVSLIAEGKLPEVPTFVDKQALSSLNTVCRQYRNLDLLFTAPDPERLRSEWNRLASMWKEDRNEGLMREVMQAHQPWQIVNLRNIYSKISITEIRTQTKNAVTGEHLRTDADVESLVSSMIGSGMLAARLEKPANGPAHVVFVEDAEILSEAAFSARVAGTAKKVTQLNELYKAMNAKLSTHKVYVAHVQRERKRLEKESESQRDPFEATVMDEDLMGGLLDSQPS